MVDMINKDTIEAAWKQNPTKTYYVIQNPKIDIKNKKLVGISTKIVKYIVRDWDSKFVNFERVDKNADKRFPEILVFDKRYADAENEVFVEKTTTKKKNNSILSYGIFGDHRCAHYHKLVRLHRMAEQMSEMYKALKGVQEKPAIRADDDKITKEAKKGIDKNSVNYSLDDLKAYFEEIQNTGYYDELEKLQTEFPDLATM